MAWRWRDRRFVIGLGLLAITLTSGGLTWWRRSTPRRDQDRAIGVTLASSTLLRSVVEPIAPTTGQSSAGSDDHWLGLTFRDASGAERTVKFVYYWPSLGPGDAGLVRTLVLDNRPVDPSSRDERACLGLLERWWRGNDAAHALLQRVRERDPTLRPVAFGSYEGITPAENGQIIAARVMLILRGRN